MILVRVALENNLKILRVSEDFILRSLAARLCRLGSVISITSFKFQISQEKLLKVVFVLSHLSISYKYLAMRLAIHKHCGFFSSLSYFHLKRPALRQCINRQ